MWKNLCLHLIFTMYVTVISAEFSKNMHTPPSKDIDKQETSLKNIPKSLGKVLEKLIPSNLKPLSGLFLGSVDTGSILQSLASYVIPTARHDTLISRRCRDDSWLYAASLANFTEWALKMYDASGKIPDGISSGNYHSMGHFDQCLNVKYEQDDGTTTKFTGKYCPVFFLPKILPKRQISGHKLEPLPSSLSFLKALRKIDRELIKDFDARTIPAVFPNLAFCLPSTCSASDVETGVQNLMGDHAIDGIQIVPYTTDAYCASADTQRTFDFATIAVIWIFILLMLLLVLGTAYDAFLRRKCESFQEVQTRQRILLSFSVLTNGAKVLDTRNFGNGYLACLSGIRFLSMAWVVLAHTWAMALQEANANAPLAKEDGRHWSFQVISNSTISVDSFLFLSGLLVSYLTLRSLDKHKGKLNVLFMYLHRFLRLTPAYAFILMFVATVLVHMGSGPFWGNIVRMSEFCRDRWWQNLLFVNNLFKGNTPLRGCMNHTWYLAVEMQLFLTSPAFIYALWRWPKAGIALVGGTIVGCTAITLKIVVEHDVPPTYIFTADNPSPIVALFNHYYTAPWCRIMPYLVGIFMGYVLHISQNRIMKINAYTVFTGWLTAAGIALVVVYGLAGYYAESETPIFPKAVSALYASLHRTAWAVALSWLVFACVHGYGGLVNKFLSWPVFLPLSRLTYCTYLIHIVLIKCHFGYMRTIPYYTTAELMFQFVAYLFVSMMLAFITTVCIETPFLQLENLLFSFLSHKEEKTSEMCPSLTEKNIDRSYKDI